MCISSLTDMPAHSQVPLKCWIDTSQVAQWCKAPTNTWCAAAPLLKVAGAAFEARGSPWDVVCCAKAVRCLWNWLCTVIKLMSWLLDWLHALQNKAYFERYTITPEKSVSQFSVFSLQSIRLMMQMHCADALSKLHSDAKPYQTHDVLNLAGKDAGDNLQQEVM